MDYYGNNPDGTNNYYESEAWARAKAANDALQASYEQTRAADDNYRASPTPANEAALTKATQQTTVALQNYTTGTNPPPPAPGAPTAKLTTDQLTTLAQKIENPPPAVMSTRTPMVKPPGLTVFKSYKKPATVAGSIIGGIWLLSLL